MAGWPYPSQIHTEWMEWMSHRKRKETKQQPGTAGPGNMLGCCLVSHCLLYDIHSTHPVHVNERVVYQRLGGGNLPRLSVGSLTSAHFLGSNVLMYRTTPDYCILVRYGQVAS